MHCDKWNENWVAQLYDELEPGERREVERHLSGCPACRARMQGMSETRSLLGASVPDVPSLPRVVVLQPRNAWKMAWAFAAGVAAASLVFLFGVLAGPGVEPAFTATVAGSDTLPAGLTPADLAGLVRGLDQRVGELERAGSQDPSVRDAALQTRAMLEDRLDTLERQVSRERVQDLDFVLQTLAASQLHTDTRMERTERTLDYLALREEPTFREK